MLDHGLNAALAGALEPVLMVEREAFCVANLAWQMEQGFIPEAHIWDDVKTVTRPRVREIVRTRLGGRRLDFIFGGIPCFAAGSYVLTKRGYIPIESVAIGDFVLTHRGRWRKVNAVMQKHGDVCQIKHGGSPGVFVTYEHPYYARRRFFQWNNSVRQYKRHWHRPEWREVSELSSADFVGQVLPEVRNTDDHSEAFWWVVGRYLADGWLRNRKSRGNGKAAELRITKGKGWNIAEQGKPSPQCIICCAKNERDFLAQKLQDAEIHFNIQEDRTTYKFHIFRTDFSKFVSAFGRYAHGKFLPGFVFELHERKSRALLDGLLSGDGYIEKRRGDRMLTTVSKALALSVCLLAQRAYGVVASIKKVSVSPTKEIEGRTVNQRDWYSVSIPIRNRSSFVEGNYGWKLFRKRVDSVDGKVSVFNLSVEEDESYIVENAIVHNCQPHSQAGKRLGSMDERDLWPATLRAVEVYQPKFVFIENVDGIASSEDGARRIICDLEKAGYRTKAGLFSSQECGANHQRKRWFFLGIADGSGCQRQDVSLSTRESEESGVEFVGGSASMADAASLRREDIGSLSRVFGACAADRRMPQFAGNGTGVADAAIGEFQNARREEDKRNGTGQSREVLANADFDFPRYAPARNDYGAWLAIISYRPELSPAIKWLDRDRLKAIIKRAFTNIVSGRNRSARRKFAKNLAEQIVMGIGEKEIKSSLCGMADGLAGWDHQLRAIGNGVDSLAAAYSFITLWAASQEES